MLFRRSVLSCGLVVAAGALAFVGCSAKPENSPKIQKKFAQVDELQTTVEDNAKFLRTLAGDMTIIKDQLSSLQSLNPETGAGQELITRLESIEKRISSIETAGGERLVASLASNTTPKPAASSTEAGAGSTLATGRASTTPAADRLIPANQLSTREKAVEKKVEAAKPTVEKASTSAAKPAAASSSKGKYYTLEAGDTLYKIATDNGISVADLERENRIPAGAKVLKGQRIFIPGK